MKGEKERGRRREKGEEKEEHGRGSEEGTKGGLWSWVNNY